MKLGPTFRLAVRALRRNKMRSLLTMLGIIIGVGAVIAMVGIGNGARAQVEAQIATLGQNMILIFAGNFSSGGVRSGYGGLGLKVEDALAIGREIPGAIGVSPEIRSFSQVAAGNQNWYTQLLGESPEYFDMRQWPLTSGVAFTDQEVRAAAKVVILGKTTASQLFGEADPVGHVIRIKNVPFMVVGLLKDKGMSLMGTDQDDVAIVPYTTAMKRLTGDTKLRAINVQAVNADEIQQIQQQINLLLRQRHGITPGKDDDFTVRSQQDIAEMATAQSKIMTLLLASIACVSLVVGGIGIMNIMLVSVTERTREIGIRMAVGAHGRDILMQFLIEAVTLSSLSGIIGIGLGFGTARILSQWMNWPTQVPMIWVALAFGVSALIGVGFGLYPAWKAAALDPIDALRYE